MNDKKVENEIFCLKYELNTLSDLLIRKKAERWLHGFIDSKTETEHLNRYKFLLDKVANKNVLDLACGSGYGSYLMATTGNAKFVTGVDIDENALRYAKIKYPSFNIKRIIENGVTYKSEEKFDVIVSFETIEHIEKYSEFIDNLYQNLKPDGTLYISTPITNKTNIAPINPYHVIEWSFYDFHDLFKNKFEITEIYLQNVEIMKKEWKVPSLIKKIKNRIIADKTVYKIFGDNFEKFTGQYDMTKCISGYQMLVLNKKCGK